ncbi:14369_t:CDS:1, partial [Entrophospora sp. SA101]
MPPKKRNSQIKTARLSKKLKNENKPNNLFVQNTLLHEQPFDFVSETDDDKTIYESDHNEFENVNEYELSDFQLSDSDSGDDNWQSKTLNNTIKELDISIFEKMIKNASNKVLSKPNRPLVYVGNSERTIRCKKAQNQMAATNTMKLTSFFEKVESNQLIISEEDNESNYIIDNTINLYESNNNFDEKDIVNYKEALICLNSLLKDKNLSDIQKKRGSIISQYFNLCLMGSKKMEA